MADEHEKASPSQNTTSQSSLCTVIVFLWIVIYMFAGFSCLGVFIYLLFTKYYWLPLLYLTWYMYDRHISERGGRSWRLFRNNVLWKYMADYFPAKLHKTAKLDAEKSYIFAIHPHGIFHVSGFLAFATEALGFSKMFPGIIPHLLILAGQFRFPVYRDCIIPSGMTSISKDSIRWILTRPGHVACIVVGGALEVLEARPGVYKLLLNKKKGFVREALKYGASLVPVYCFGEVELYDQIDNPDGSTLKAFQTFLCKKICGFCPTVVTGCGFLNFLPLSRPLNIVVGEPIEVEKSSNPSQEEIDGLHEKYVTRLLNLFENHKTKYGLDETTRLTIKD